MPSSGRLIEPVRIGVATSKPNSVPDRPSSVCNSTPTMEKITQTARHTLKAKVQSHSARERCGGVTLMVVLMWWTLADGPDSSKDSAAIASMACGSLQEPKVPWDTEAERPAGYHLTADDIRTHVAAGQHAASLHCMEFLK